MPPPKKKRSLADSIAEGSGLLTGGVIAIVAVVLGGAVALFFALGFIALAPWWLWLLVGIAVAFGLWYHFFVPEETPPPLVRPRPRGPYGEASWADGRNTSDAGLIVSQEAWPAAVFLNRGMNVYAPATEEEIADKWCRAAAFESQTYLGYSDENNIVTVAPAGAGKGTQAIIPTLLTCQESAFVLDVKGENYFVTHAHRAGWGHNIVLINPFNLWGRELGYNTPLTHHFNPLANLHPDQPSFVKNISELAAAMILPEGSDPHWSSRARDLVTCLIGYVCTAQGETPTLPRVRQILGLPRDEFTLIMYKAFESTLPIVRDNAGSFTDPTAKETNGVITTALGQLSFLNEPAIANFLSSSDFDFYELRRQPTTIYCMLPPNELETYYRFVRLLVQSLFNALSTNAQENERRVLLILDEQAKLRHMPVIQSSAALLRGYKVRIWSVFQDLNQLKAIYGDAWESFIANAGVLQFFNPNDAMTAEYISKRVGKETLVVDDYSHTSSSSSGPQGGSSGGSNTRSSKQVGADFLSVQDLYGMPDNRGILLRRGLQFPVLLDRRHYFSDPAFVGRSSFLPNPYHDATAAFAAARQHHQKQLSP